MVNSPIFTRMQTLESIFKPWNTVGGLGLTVHQSHPGSVEGTALTIHTLQHIDQWPPSASDLPTLPVTPLLWLTWSDRDVASSTVHQHQWVMSALRGTLTVKLHAQAFSSCNQGAPGNVNISLIFLRADRLSFTLRNLFVNTTPPTPTPAMCHQDNFTSMSPK